MKLVSAHMPLPFSQYCVSSPTFIQLSGAGGTSKPRCAVMMKLVKSVCGLMPVCGACFAKKTSTEGVAARRTRSTVLGNSLTLLGSHSHRSCNTSVRQSGPYPSASSRAAATQMALPFCSNSGSRNAARSSSRIVS